MSEPKPRSSRVHPSNAFRCKKTVARAIMSLCFMGLFVFSLSRAERSGDYTISAGYGVLLIVSLVFLFMWWPKARGAGGPGPGDPSRPR